MEEQRRAVVKTMEHECDCNNAPPMLEWSDSHRVGSCNFCNAHTTERGTASHRVLVVGGNLNGGVRVRLCERCAKAVALAARW
jgi:hypothetical protein